MATEEDIQHRENNNNSKDHADHADLKQTEKNPIYDQLFSLGVTLTSNRLGQYAVRKIDRLIWVIENTAKWSVPQNITESETSVPPPPLIRPLNWFLFIPALIVMRLFRAGASFALLMFGCDALAPITIVHILQKHRRILRAIRYQGLKTIRSKNAENKVAAKKNLFGVLLSFVSGLICSRGTLEEPVKIVVKSDSRADGHASKKRLLSDDDDHEINNDEEHDLNMTCADLLDKYGSISSCDDSDFEPEAIDDDSSSDSSEESEPEGRPTKDVVEEEDKEAAKTTKTTTKEAEKEEEPNKTNTSEPVKIIQNNIKYCNENKKESRPATLYGSNPEDKFYSPIESPVPPEEHNHSVTIDTEDSHESIPSVKLYHTQPHSFNHNQPTRQDPNRFNFHYQHNPHQPSHQNHNKTLVNSAGFLASEKSFNNAPPHQLSHHMNGGRNTQHVETKIHHVPPPPPSSLSPTSSTSSSTTNISTAQAGSTTAAGNNRKKSQTKYNKYQKNRYYGGANKQNSKKASF